MTSLRRALAFSFGERYVLIAIGLLSNVLLARLLTPEQIGLYSVSLAVIGIAQVLRDFGIGTFLIQEKNLHEDHVRTAFGVSLLIGGSLFGIVFAAAPFAGRFYDADQLVETMRISSLNFLVLPFCTISLALLRREMLFKRLVSVTVTATMVAASATIALAYMGWGPNSMAIGAVLGNVVTGIGTWFARKDRKFLAPGLSQWRALLKFGGQSSLANVVTSISMDANDLVVGKLLGFHPVAILSRAQGLMNLFHRDLMGAVRGVALPAFAAAHRSGTQLEAAHTRSVAVITALAWPFYGLVSLYALEALRLLFGPQWDAARALVPIFCFAGAVASLNALIPTLLVATGRIDLLTRTELVVQPLRLLLIIAAAAVVGTTQACAIAYAIASVCAAPVFYGVKSRAVSNDTLAWYAQMKSSALVAAATLSPAIVHNAVVGFARDTPLPVWQAGLVVLVSALIWLGAVRRFHHPVATEAWFIKLLASATAAGKRLRAAPP